MADTKILAMPNAIVPLTGIEQVPIVQLGSNVKVASSAIGSLQTISSGNLTDGGTNNFDFVTGTGGVAPSRLSVRLLCTNNDASSGALVGDEIDVSGIFNATESVPYVTFGSNGTTGYVFTTDSAGRDLSFSWRSGSGNTISNLANFKIKVYWGT